jgi:glutamate-ammonia-ligase adenylyltransferase
MERFFLKGEYLVPKTLEDKMETLRALVSEAADPSALGRLLRGYKELEYLRIGCRDLAGLADLREVMQELSDLAAASIQAALDFHFDRLIFKHGGPPGLGDRTGFVVIGLGKIGGGELNFSSDVDLMFLRRAEEGYTLGPESISVTRFYESLAQSITSSVSEVTEDGFVFRVDLRLRPEGEKGELVPSVTNALNYYLQWGRTWERAALMKAVPVAGDLALGRSFLKALEPFVYRKHLDYTTLEDMREMKLRIEKKLRRKPGINIKLGQGGIREIEFFVQALQLINGGRNPVVRSPSTLKSLDLFRETRLLDKETTDQLQEAYLFFRNTEHRIQINHQLQTHDLPRTVQDQEELAARMGYRENALQAFLADLEKRRRLVEELFSSLFYSSSEEIVQQCSSKVRALLNVLPDESAATQLLVEYGLEDPSESYHLLKDLLTPSDTRAFSEKGSRLLEHLGPLFLEELLMVPEPAKALVALDRYIRSLHGGPGYFSTLLENPPTARFLVRLLGESRFFAELLIRHPQTIDSLIGRWTVQHPKEKEPLEKELADRLAYCEDFESELDVLRIFKNEQILRIGVSHLTGEINSPTARWLITELAEVCLGTAVRVAVQEMGRKFGHCDFFDSLPFVILGMGKLGGMEMTYLSDVDVIFIYDEPSESCGGFSIHEWFTRLTHRIISILNVPTSEGTVFAIDTRLRPSGQMGPLVSSLSSFREYHRTTSKLWEKQALIKARPVYGPPRLTEEVSAIVRDCVLRTDISAADLREIDRLRRRMESELAMEDKHHVDLKTGHGGLVDVEFFVQAKILTHAKNRPEVLHPNTLEALASLRAAGLIDEGSFQTMNSGYRFLTNLEDRLRIMEHRSVDRMPLEGDKLRGLASRLGYREGEEELLVRDYHDTTDSIRATYASFFGLDEKKSGRAGDTPGPGRPHETG